MLAAQERIDYHDPAVNRAPVQRYVERLLAAEALVLCFPVWNFGLPALLKGFSRSGLPAGRELRSGRRRAGRPGLRHIRKLAAITTYGRRRLEAWLVGDPPRSWSRGCCAARSARPPACHLAHYHMNVSTAATRARFLAKVERAMARF